MAKATPVRDSSRIPGAFSSDLARCFHNLRLSPLSADRVGRLLLPRSRGSPGRPVDVARQDHEPDQRARRRPHLSGTSRGVEAPGREVLPGTTHVDPIVPGDRGEGHRHVAQGFGGQERGGAPELQLDGTIGP